MQHDLHHFLSLFVKDGYFGEREQTSRQKSAAHLERRNAFGMVGQLLTRKVLAIAHLYAV